MPEIIDEKEAIEFGTRFIGGSASVGLQMLFDWYWWEHPDARDRFPFTRPHENLPAYHNLIVSGISIGEALVGLGLEEDPLKLIPPASKEQAKKFGKGLRQIGEGGVLYTVPRLTRITIVRSATPASPGSKAQQEKPRQPAASRGRVIKL